MKNFAGRLHGRRGFLLLLPSLAIAAVFVATLAARTPELSGQLALSAGAVSVEREGQYDHVTVAGWAADGAPGAPLLPVQAIVVEIPEGTRPVGVVVEDRAEIEMEGPYRPLPAPSADEQGNAVHVEGASYRAAGSIDGDVLEVAGQGFEKGRAVAYLNFHAVRWNPGSGSLTVTTQLRYRLELTAAEVDAPRPLAARPIAPPGGDMILLDPGQYPSLDGSSVEYLIIAPDSLAAEFQRLADWRTRSGTPAVVRTLTQVAAAHPEGIDLAEKMRLFVRDAYTYWGTRWVLLGGEVSLVPTRKVFLDYFYPNGGFVSSDLYFSSLDGSWNHDRDGIYGEAYVSTGNQGDWADLYPDVFVGRAPVQSVAETATFINKMIAYQRNADPTYVRRALFAAEVVFPADWSVGETILMNGCDLAHGAGEFLPAGWDTLYLCQWPHQNETLVSVANALNSGYHLVTVVGHGDAFKWSTADKFFMIDNALAMTNNNKFSIFFYANCNTNQGELECLNEYMLLHPTGGAIATVATTHFDFPDYGRYYHEEFYRLYSETNIPTLGEIQALMKVPFIPLSSRDSAHRWTQFVYNVLGDPAMPVWRTNPTSLTLTRPPGMTVGDSTFSVTVRKTIGLVPVGDALVTMWKPGGGEYARGMTNASGVVNLPFRPDATGLVRLTVTHPAYYPAVDSLQVSAGAPRVALEGITIDDDAIGASLGNGNGLMEPGERIELGLTLRNVGTTATGSLGGELSTRAGSRLIADLLVDGLQIPGRIMLGVDRIHPAALPCTLGLTGETALGRPAYTAEALGDTAADPQDSSAVDLAARAYAWQDAGGWHFRTAGALQAHSFSGWVRSDGGFRSMSRFRLESGDVTTESGDSIGFSFTVGTTEAEDGLDVMPADSAFVHLVSDSMDYGSIAPGATATRTFVLDVTSGAPDHRRTRLDLSAVTASWSRLHGVDVEIHSPDLEQAFHAVNDSIGGDNDKVPEPGETVELRVTILNRGSGAANTVSGVLHATSGCTVIDSVASWGTIAPGAQVTNTVPLRLSVSAAALSCDLTLTSSQGESWLDTFDMGAPTRPPAPVWVSSLSSDHWIDLQWSPVVHSDLRGYNLYAGTTVATLVNPRLIEGTCTYRVDGLTPETLANYRLAAVDSAGNLGPLSAFRTVRTGSPSQPGWPVTARNRMWSSPAIADVNQNGNREVVVGSRDWRLFVWTPTGVALAGWPKVTGDQIDSSPAIGDVDGNGTNEVFVGSDDKKLYAWTAGGLGFLAPSGIFATRTHKIRSSPTLADIDGDGKLDILVGDDSGKLSVFRWNGTGLLNPDGTWATVTGPIISSPSVADVDSDGLPEIFVTTHLGGVFAWNHDGTPVRLASGSFRFIGGGNIYSSPSLGDIDNNGTMEVVVSGGNDSVYVFRPNSNPLTGWPKWTGSSNWSSPALGDLDNDGKLEVIVGSNNGKLNAWRPTGVPLPGWPVTLPDSVVSSPVVGDITGDTFPEVVVGCHDGRVYAYGTAGTPVAGWPRATHDMILSAPAIGDIDLDGGVEVLCGSFDGFMYCFNVGVPYNASTMDWPMFKHDRHRSGWSGWVEPLATTVPGTEGAAGTVRVTSLAPPNPNPAPGGTRISFDLAAPGPVTLAIFDVNGRRVELLASGQHDAGHYEIAWRSDDQEGRRLAPGIYFLRLEAAGDTRVRKLVIAN